MARGLPMTQREESGSCQLSCGGVSKLQDVTTVPEDLSFQFIREITDDFLEERILGEGAFGVVYKGVTKNGQDVAVKKLKPCCADLDNKQFRNEFHTLMKLNHQNIVQILGYCYETMKKPFIMPDGSKVFVDEIHTALCFEYLHNGSLQKHLSDEYCEVKLDWHMRFRIIKGICEGLKYMHKDLEEPIYHFDLKPDNILLDKDMVPKIADFGLSRIFGQDIIRTTHGPYGTLGYQPPEYIDRREISGKFDIFSLGAVIKRIVSRPMGYPECSHSMSSDAFIDQVRENWRKKLQEECSSDSLLEAYCRQVETCTEIALNCLDEDSQKRPDIVKITEKLNGIDVGIGKLPEKGWGISFSEMTVQNNSIGMRKESKDITIQHQNTDLLSSPSCTELELVDARETSTDVVELIVGREEEKGKIITSLLESSSKKISILPIHGIGGIGKTTFSRLIYNDPKFKSYSKAWVHVSHRFDLNKIRESIISQLSEKQNQANERHVVHSSLTKLLPGKKIMIVLDDLWEDNQFQLMDLKDMLYHDDSNIIILVTTRSESVAERICTNLQPYKILPLTNDMCWDIIKQRSGFGAREDKEKLRGIGQEIANKCAGVALAAQSLGFTLRGMNFDQWMKVKHNDIWKEHISKDISLPNHVLASLMLSYSYMDPCLKPCFTYCAIFPKGHRIVKNDLVYQWISLGFIKPTELLSVMDLCKKYIMQLQGLSFLQESPKSAEAYSEKTTIFTMHDLVHDLAISLLGNKLLDKSKQENTMRKNKDYQYAVLRDCRMPLWLTREAQLKALHFLECSGTALRGAAFAPATSLRVLDLSDCCSHKLPDSIGQLKELRYLNAPWTRDLQFPECITKLSHLIFLNLHGSDIEKIPESIGEMKDLRHLDLSCCRIKRLPDSFMSLQKLVHLDFSNCHLMLGESESLWSLSRLEHLSLSKCRIEGDLAKALCGLRELQYLELSHLFCWGNLGRGLQQVTKLMYLDIRGFLDRNIVGGAETEAFIEAISSLSNLVYLNLGWNQNLYYIPESIGNLSKLRTLDLSHCINLERLPAAISGINNMKFVHVAGCDRLDKSTLPLYKNVAKLLPYFVVHAGDSESSSNLRWLEYENPTKLELSGLENVKSIGEAQRIKLVEKQRIQELGLVWTRDAKRFVDDEGVLKQLVPPYTVGQMRLQGYNSAGFPSWMMDIATYVPHLVDVTLEDMPNCSSLPPLGQLPNLKKLWIGRMESIRKIGQDLYGDCGAFPLLTSFTLQEMKCLEEWNTSYSYHNAGGKDASKKVLAFPNLQDLFIADCPMLRFKSLSPLALGKEMTITRSGQVVLSSWECRGQFDASSSARTTWLSIEHCEAPLHQWSLLRHLPHLTKLSINNCSDLTCSSTDLLRCLRSLEALYVRDCKSIAALPERLGDLTSLNKLDISNCEGVKALPESIQLLTRLRRLKINGCPQLVQFRCPPSLKTLYVRNCKSIVQLPQRLADLSSLKNLEIIECEGVKALPESIQQLTCLQRLGIYGCPQLLQWCQSKENEMKLAHIKEREYQGEPLPEEVHKQQRLLRRKYLRLLLE
ncbi:hypothetical protein BDA96_05G106900 [Sorghum bicolor]|uniref:non-specific serine/threonine protein kinase n=1 Tax=Sorghum bicolor TaxID=4558 RepID=A0A921QZ53_SORBI|nr:hypothetical protein BDA96_05G106900 [Sorghum bicolor]